MNKKVITLIRFARVAPIGDVGTEPTPPIGLAYLSAMCKEAETAEIYGIDASGKNLNNFFNIPQYKMRGNGLTAEEVINLIDPNTSIFGVTSMFTHEWLYIRDCIKLLKRKYPKSVIVVGGEHASALTEYSLRDCKEIDYISLGEGEETWRELALKDDNNFKDVAGLAYLENDQFIKTKVRERIKRIDSIPWPDWDTFPIEPYLDNAISFGPGSGRNMPIIASRGCPYECTFCSNPIMFGRRYYVRDIEDLIRQIKYYIKRYKITGLQFYDLTVIIKKEWIVNFCNALIENNINLQWSLPTGTRSEALDLDVIKALAKAKLTYLVYAPESGDEETLKRIKKKIKIPAVEQSVRYAVSQGIVTRTNLIIGFPGETRMQLYRTLRQQLKFIFMGVEESSTFVFNAYPGTELFDQLLKEGKITLNDEYFISLGWMSHYNILPNYVSYNEKIGRYELYFYRILGMFLTYTVPYIIRPKRILRTIKNFFKDESSTVAEQRLKDHLRKSMIFTKFIKPFILRIFSIKSKKKLSKKY
jgi:radical SAM superfamily enzyme YgiQ (UPF0313 family)|tara:strand:- start:76 stop:1665 length:1590 start_codon:yes stop_codon:yes gene_type:complete